jgi:hypothetical protein
MFRVVMTPRQDSEIAGMFDKKLVPNQFSLLLLLQNKEILIRYLEEAERLGHQIMVGEQFI